MGNAQKIVSGGAAHGSIHVPGDKSISIRAVLLAAIADGTCRIHGLGTGEDIRSALNCIAELGIHTEYPDDSQVFVKGKGLYGFQPVNRPIDCGNSGTTLRLLTGILAGQGSTYCLTGDDSLRQRPMDRIMVPLREMGALFECPGTEGMLPYTIMPSELHPVAYTMPVASAQVKSAIILAGLYAKGTTTVIEPVSSRDHTERMLASCGVAIETEKNENRISVSGIATVQPFDCTVPGDISGAAFFAVLACLLPDSHITIKNVGMNNTRTGVIDVLRAMGAKIREENAHSAAGEETADLSVVTSNLKGVEIRGEIIPRIIDELPIIAIAGTFASGKTIIRDAGELRVKETDRIHALCVNLRKMGVEVDELSDGLIIQSNENRHCAEFDSFGDHRIAMAFAVAGAVLEGESIIHNGQWADISFPGFYTSLDSIRNMQ